MLVRVPAGLAMPKMPGVVDVANDEGAAVVATVETDADEVGVSSVLLVPNTLAWLDEVT